MAVAARTEPCLQLIPAVPGVAGGRAAAVDTSWGLSWWSALHPRRGFLSLPVGQNRVNSETRVVEQGEES